MGLKAHAPSAMATDQLLSIPNKTGPALLRGRFIVAWESLLDAIVRCAWA
jgi:hypothetical protein